MRKNLQQAVVDCAAKHHGNITRQQLLKLGIGSGMIAYWIEVGYLFPVHRGVYAVGRPPRTGWEKAAAAVLACGSGAALSHASSLTLWGLWRRWDMPYEVSVIVDRRPRGISVHHPRNLHRRDVATQHGIRATTPARTLLDMATRLPNLKRTVNNALHSPYLSEGQLADVLARHRHHPSTPLLRPFAGPGQGLTRSELEDGFVTFCQQHDLPQPRTNFPLGGYIVDAYFPQHGLIVELDSVEFHSTRIDFETDRERDADHLSDGIPTLRVTHERLTGQPEREADRLRRILRGARATRGAPAIRRRARGRRAR